MSTSGVLVKFFASTALLYLMLLGAVAGAIPRSISLVGMFIVWLLGRRKAA